MISPEILRHYPNFVGASDGHMKEIASISRVRDFEAGERLFCEGNTATHLQFVISGEVNIVYRLGSGQEVVADTLVAGDPLAWSALLEPHRLTASGVGSKPGALLEIDAEGLRRLCERDRNFGYFMMKEIAKTLRSRLSAMRIQAAATLAEPEAEPLAL